MYEKEMKQLKDIFSDTPNEELTAALIIADGNFNLAVNHLVELNDKKAAKTASSTDEEVEQILHNSVVPAPKKSIDKRSSVASRKIFQFSISPVSNEYDDIDEDFIIPPELPADAQMPKNIEIEETQKEIVLRVKVLQPIGNYPSVLSRMMIENLFVRCHVEFKFERRSMLPRAEYEDQVAEWKYEITINLENHQKSENQTFNAILAVYSFLEKFCHYSSLELHDQLMLELPDFPHIMNTLVVHHTKPPIMSIMLGNCPNPGLFYIRGYYITYYNTFSNSQIAEKVMRHPNRTDDQHQTKCAGNQLYRSFGDFEHDRRNLTLYFAIQIPEKVDGLQFAGYKIVIPYSAIVQIVVDMRQKNTNGISLKLKYPPQLWEATPRYHGGRKIMNMENTREWVRVLQFPGDEPRFSGCSKDALADCQWLQLQIPSNDERPGADIKILLMELISRIMVRSNAKVHFGGVFAQFKRLPIIQDFKSIGSFRADYALKAMISRGSVITDQLFEYVADDGKEEHIFFRYARWCFKECRQACEEALENMLAAVDERRTFEVLKAFHHHYNIRVDAYKRMLLGDSRGLPEGADLRKALPKNCVLVRKVMITPLRRLFMAPEVMMTNRVVRKYGEEHALRCVFRDENGGKIQVKDFASGFSTDQQSAIITAMVHQTLTHGVEINNRTYHFLAWSNSQMRDHGCYMYAPIINLKTGVEETSIEQMREWMGNFSNVKSVPKLMSRMGQCFTQAQPTVILTKDMWRVDKDFEGGEGHPETGEIYCFSDGCGRIAPSLSREVARILDLELIPSCFQVRFKGFKGILVVDPTLDQINDGVRIIFRKSQQKFHVEEEDDESNTLEIVKYSMPSAVCLNRPMIAILDWVAEAQDKQLHQKLSRKVHYYLERELSTLGSMLLNEKIAAEQLSQRINLPIDFIRLRNCGFGLTDEPLIRKMLVSVYRYNIANHLTKLKIFIPANQGRCMYGVVDETGLLQYGQVFIQYSPTIRSGSDKPKLHLGPVLITKNPCHVAGDVRMFEAVYQPALAHLVDVVVFPRHGPRPHPDEMAGSDLDGDEYSLIFDTDVHFKRNEEAMCFPKSVAEEYDEPPQTEAMVHFFLKYLRQDAIGKVSNAHLIMADRRGLFDDIPNEIARKCSVAVDFPKSGQPAEPLTPLEQSDRNPDYMATSFKPAYRSKRLNGQLYRKARKVEEVLELTEHLESVFERNIDRDIVPENVDLFAKDPNKKKEYIRLRDEYATRIQQLLDEYGISDEAAIVSGHIVNLKRLTGMERDDYSFYHTDKIVELRYAKIFYHFRSLFLREFGEHEEDLYDVDKDGVKIIRTNSVMFEKARRWYQVAYDQRADDRAPGPCKSFPWVVWDVLAAFKRERRLVTGVAMQRDNPIADELNMEIVEFCMRNYDEYRKYEAELKNESTVIKSYLKAYGDSLMRILYVLRNWLNREELFEYTPMRMEHVILIFIQFCRGVQHGCRGGVADSADYSLIFAYSAAEAPVSSRMAVINHGVVLLNFLRYLGSQRFCLAENLNLKVDHEFVAPLLLRQNQWIPLSQLAFRAYHQIAVSGRFDALRLYATDFDVIEAENKEPIVVSGELFNSNNYGQQAIPSQVIIDRLKLWSGISFMNFRPDKVRTKNSVGQYLCTVYGTVAARQRITRLLQMEVPQLLKAVLEDRIPLEVYDMSI